MNQEKEYQEFMIKLMNKAKEVHDDFETLSYENQKKSRTKCKFFRGC